MGKKITMFKRWFAMLFGKTAVANRQDKGRAYSLNEVKGFYNDLTLKVCDGTDVDENGIPMSLIGGGKHVYFPIAVFQYGLANYDLWLINNNIENYNVFCRICKWAIDNQFNNGSWNCFGPIESKKYTVSAMGQGEGAALLLRYYLETKDECSYVAAKKAIDFMLLPIKNGGTAYYDENNNIVFEEYAHKDRSTVLNGWIFAYFGLYDFCKVSKDDYYIDCAKRTIEAMVQLLPMYDIKYWSKYDLTGKIASPAYQILHIALLEVMYEITNKKEFKEYAEKWDKNLNSKWCKFRAVLKKFFQKLTEKTDAVIIK